MAQSAVQEIIVRVKADGTDAFIKSLKDAGIEVEKQEKKIKKGADGISSAFKKVGGLVAGVFAVGAIKNFASASVSAFATFNQQLQELSAITGLVDTDLERLEQSAKKLALGSRQSSAEVLNAFKLIGSAKPELLENVDALTELTEASIVLSEASGLTLPESAQNLGNSLNALQLPASEAGRLINILAAASQKGAKEIPFVADALSKFGGISAQAGLEVSESVSAIELLGKAIPEASIVGTNLRNILIKLQVASAESGEEFTSLADSLDDLAPLQKNVTELTERFGDRNLLAIQTLISQREELRALQGEIENTNTAYEQQAVQAEGAKAQLDKLRNSFSEFRVSLGELLFNTFQPLIAGLTRFLQQLADLPNFLKENRTEIRLLAIALVGLKLGTIVTQVRNLRIAFIAWSASARATATSIGFVTRAIQFLTSATGIGLVITLVSSLVFAFQRLSKRAKDTADDIADVNEELQETVTLADKLTKELVIDVLFDEGSLDNFRDAIKGLDEESLVALSQGLTDRVREFTRLVQNTQQSIDEGLDVDEGGFPLAVILKTATLELDVLRERLGLAVDELQKFEEVIKPTPTNTLKQLQEDLKKLNEEIGITPTDSPLFDQLNLNAFDLEKRIKVIQDRIKKLRGDDSVAKALEKINQQLEKFRIENRQAQLDDDQRELEAVKEKYQKLADEAEDFTDKQVEIFEEYQKAVSNLQDKFNKRDLDAFTKFGEDLIDETDRISLARAQLLAGTAEDPLGKEARKIEQDIEITGVEDEKQRLLDELDEIQKTQEALGEDRVITEQEIQDARLQVIQNATDKEKDIREKFRKEEEEAEKEFLDNQRELRLEEANERIGKIEQGATEVFDFLTSINDLQQKLLEDRLEKGLLSQEEYDKKTAELKTKQARQDKAQAVFNIGLNTATAILKAIAEFPITVGQPFVSLIIAFSALQLAQVLATPIPKFAKGTKGKRKAPAGFAWVGEEGAELVQMRGGEKVITHGDSEEIMKILGSYSIPVQFQSTQDRMDKRMNLLTIGKSSTGSMDISPMLQATDKQSRVLSKKLDRLNSHFERINLGRLMTKN